MICKECEDPKDLGASKSIEPRLFWTGLMRPTTLGKVTVFLLKGLVSDSDVDAHIGLGVTTPISIIPTSKRISISRDTETKIGRKEEFKLWELLQNIPRTLNPKTGAARQAAHRRSAEHAKKLLLPVLHLADYPSRVRQLTVTIELVRRQNALLYEQTRGGNALKEVEVWYISCGSLTIRWVNCVEQMDIKAWFASR